MLEYGKDYIFVKDVTEEWGCDILDILLFGALDFIRIHETHKLCTHKAPDCADSHDLCKIVRANSDNPLPPELIELDELLDALKSITSPLRSTARDHMSLQKAGEFYSMTYKELSIFTLETIPLKEGHEFLKRIKNIDALREKRKNIYSSKENDIFIKTYGNTAKHPETAANHAITKEKKLFEQKYKAKETIFLEVLTLEMPPVGHPFHSPTLSATIHCWNTLYKDRPSTEKKIAHKKTIKDWLIKNYRDTGKLSDNNADLITETINPNTRGSYPDYHLSLPDTEEPNAEELERLQTHIEISKGQAYVSEKLITAIRCWNHFYKGKTASAPLTRKDVQKENILTWLIENYPDLKMTPRGKITKIVNPNPTGR